MAMILTWNPRHWDFDEGEYEGYVKRSNRGGSIAERGGWSVGRRRHGVVVGERAFLLRQGSDRRGIVAAGAVASEPYPQVHWDGSGREAWYVDVVWDRFVDLGDRVPVDELIERVPSVPWNHLLSSGNPIGDAEAETVETLWSGLHEARADRPATGDSVAGGVGEPSFEPLLPAWPEVGSPVDELITVDPVHGAGYGDPATRKLIEDAAIQAVTDHYQVLGHTVDSVEREKCGWDLTCTAGDGTVARVEVKGTAGSKPTVLLTRNEHRSAGRYPGWVLAVVTRAATQPTVSIYEAADALKLAEPYVYRLDLSDAIS